MIIERNPNYFKIVTTNIVCEYHKKNPSDRNYPGCTCSSSISYVRKTDAEKREDEDKRIEKIKEKLFIEYDELWKRLAKL